MLFTETTQIWGKEFPGSMFHDAWELLFFLFDGSPQQHTGFARFVLSPPSISISNVNRCI
jgi:hypothetical protein